MSEWTDEQRSLLVECSYHMTQVTGHDINDCLKEMVRIVRAYKAGKADDMGRSV